MKTSVRPFVLGIVFGVLALLAMGQRASSSEIERYSMLNTPDGVLVLDTASGMVKVLAPQDARAVSAIDLERGSQRVLKLGLPF